MDPETVENFCKLGFTSKSCGSGMGITEERIMVLKERLGMEIQVDSELGKGTEVKLYFPI